MSFLKIRKKGEQGLNKEDLVFPLLPKDQIGITKEAKEKIISLNSGFLRIALLGGGCSGFTINFDFCDKAKENDIVFNHDQAFICIDKKSLNLLGGSTLHVVDNYFVIINSPFKKKCSCGQSFSL